MPKITIWTPEQAKRELSQRFQHAQEAKLRFEAEFRANEQTVYNTRGDNTEGAQLSVSFESRGELGAYPGVDNTVTNIGVNYVFKNLRLIHSQLSANPPTVVARPTSNDLNDRRKADAADRIVRYSVRKYGIPEYFDQLTLHMLIYGTGFIKLQFDPNAGDPLEFNEATGELLMDGDMKVTVPSPWDVYIDPDAQTWGEVRYLFERTFVPYEQACFLWPEQKEILEKYRITEDARAGQYGTQQGNEKLYNVVQVYEYWEPGFPYNGMQGRFCYMTPDCDVLGTIGPSPFRFGSPKDHGLENDNLTSAPKPEGAKRAFLPYLCLTDIDVPRTIWGRSTVAFAAPLQDILNRLDNVTLDCIQAHGITRMVLPEGAEISDDSITNSPWDIIKTTGAPGTEPHFMQPMPLPPTDNFRATLRQAIDDMFGVNESMFGQQSRETSGFSMQYATNQGNMVRRRLFNKYAVTVEQFYKQWLMLVREHWTEKRSVYVLGKERAFEAIDLKGADIAGGYDLVTEYGASLPLDPMMRRQELLTLMPVFERTGVPDSTILSLLKLSDLEGLHDRAQLARDRQYEIFEEMMSTGIYIPPRQIADHKGMLDFAYEYVMTSEFKYLAKEYQALIERHIEDREQLAAQGAAAAAGAAGPPAVAGGAPNPAALPAVPNASAPLDVTQQVGFSPAG